jgi:CRP/FNR family transcriptional regulator, anaerobic regulatory protein
MTHSADTIAQVFPFLKKNPRLVQEFSEHVLSKTLPANVTIYTEGDSCSQIAFVLTGEIRVFKASASGREITLYEIGPGDTCILNASCIFSNTGYPANALTAERTEVLLLPSPIFKNFLQSYAEIQGFIYAMLSERLTAVMTLIEEVVFNRMDNRLFEYLVERSDNAIISRTHQSIANDLGTSREVVSRLLKDFQAKKIIRCGRNHIEILDYQPDHLQTR